jgi:hypothetical protein
VGFQTQGAKKSACKYCITRREIRFQKKAAEILVGKHIQQQQEGFILVSLDESFFFYDSLVRRVWIDKEKRLVVRVTGSHKHLCLFGAVSMEGKQLFRQYERFNGDTFLDYLKLIHNKFPKCYLFMDKASPHYRSRKVIKYLEENKDILIPIYLPTASP